MAEPFNVAIMVLSMTSTTKGVCRLTDLRLQNDVKMVADSRVPRMVPDEQWHFDCSNYSGAKIRTGEAYMLVGAEFRILPR